MQNVFLTFCHLFTFSFILGLLKCYNDWKWVLIEIEFPRGKTRYSGSEGVYLLYQLFNHTNIYSKHFTRVYPLFNRTNISSISCLPAVPAVKPYLYLLYQLFSCSISCLTVLISPLSVVYLLYKQFNPTYISSISCFPAVSCISRLTVLISPISAVYLLYQLFNPTNSSISCLPALSAVYLLYQLFNPTYIS